MAYDGGPTGKPIGKTTSVNHFKVANTFGLSDMHGNVWEWCMDHYHDSYEGAPTDGSAWVNEDTSTNKSRVLRGGSWNNYRPLACRSANRYFEMNSSGDFVGFRIVCRV